MPCCCLRVAVTMAGQIPDACPSRPWPPFHDRMRPLTWEPPWGIEPQTYALRACHYALLPESGRHRRCDSQGATVGGCWLFTVLRGHDGGTNLLRAMRSLPPL